MISSGRAAAHDLERLARVTGHADLRALGDRGHHRPDEGGRRGVVLDDEHRESRRLRQPGAHAVEERDHLVHAARAVRRVLREHPPHERREARGRVGTRGPRVRHGRVRMHPHDLHDGGVVVRKSPRQALVGHDAQRVDVDEIELTRLDGHREGLRREVVSGAPAAQAALDLDLRLEDAEVREDDPATRGEQHVGRLDVAVGHPGRVDHAEPLGDADEDVDRVGDGERLSRARRARRCGPASCGRPPAP